MKHMKTVYPVIICFLLSISGVYAQQDSTNTARKSTPDFENWTEEQIVQWEDSVRKALYPEVSIDSIAAPSQKDLNRTSRSTASSMTFTNSHVKDSYPVDKTKDVGEIPISSSLTPTGAMTYNIPVEASPGRQGFHPQLSATYNSLAGNGMMGVGWSIGGLSMIQRVGRSIYYDGKSQGVALTKDDAFVLDGTRLIKLSETSTQILYETEQGLVKVKAFLSGSIILYFEVRYPNGNKGIFGYTTNGSNRLSYPLTSLTDLRGNTITYAYTLSYNQYYITSITYTGASITFQYATTRPDPVVTYESGVKVTDNRLLQQIECKSGGTTFRTYAFTYQTSFQNTSMLTQIGCTASGKSLNPLRFFYGEGNTSDYYTKAETQLREWYNFTEPDQLIVSKGKFDYGTENDGLISLPYKNPHWQHFRNSTWFRRSQNRYDNNYDGTEKIFLYAGLNSSYADPMPNLTTESGFTDIFCANIDGKYEEEVIKVNNTVSGSYDRLQFKVYSGNLYTGIALKDIHAFNFSTVLTDADDGKSIHPKFHFTGDFNGDGKMEVLSVSNNHPFGWTDKPGRCYLFDLDLGTKLYEGTPFVFYKEFVGSKQDDEAAAEQNSDRLFALDYDGDGKTDICLINDNGTHIYTFDVTGSTYTVRLVSSYTALKKSTLEGRQLMIGEFNGDGKPDFLLSPKIREYDWAIYYAMGNGQFERVALSIISRGVSNIFLIQDLNYDGLSDLVQTGVSGRDFYTFLAKPGGGFLSPSHTSINIGYETSIIIPTNINSRNYFHQLISLHGDKVTRLSFPRNDTKEKQLTGAVNSLGVVSKNYYQMLNESNYYTKGYGAEYPFENFHGPFSVPVSTEQYVNGQRNENMEYRYENAVIHKQGRGFCGFGKIVTIDNTRGPSYTKEYDPYKFGTLKSDESPTVKSTYTWTASESNKIAKVRLTNSSILNKLTNQTVTSAYVYDSYGNVTKESVNYNGGVTAVTDQTYYNSTSGSIYMIGQPVTKTMTNTRGGSSWIDKETYTYNTVRLPLTRITHTGASGGSKTGETRWTYDTNWNITSETSAPYNVTEFLGNTYTYDGEGKFVTSVTNALGQKKTYSNFDKYGNAHNIIDHKNRITYLYYDVWGRLTSVEHPDGVTETTAFAWGGTGLFTVTNTAIGSPTVITHYNALGREIRSGNQRFDAQWQYVDKAYDSKGRLEKVSLPFKGASPSYWNSYSYDTYHRPTQLSEASGKTTSWSYSGLSVTETKNGIATTKTTDASGALVSVTDPGGTITYTLRPDGQPTSITAPGNIVTSFGYDSYGRQTSIADPSAGTQSFNDVYSAVGVLTRTVTDANNKTVTTLSDKYGRVTNVNRPEFSTTYVYNEDGVLTNETSTNGTSALFTYDTYDRPETARENAPDGKWLQKTFVYAGGNVSSVQYTSQNGSIATENFVYANGHNTEIKLNGTTTIWKLTEENALGQPTKSTTGTMNRTYSYTAYGMPTGRTAGTIQNFTYNFDVLKGNLNSRKDNNRNLNEIFGYDNLNRLGSIGSQQIAYAANGNITQMPGVGTLSYENTAKPYQVTMFTPTGDAVPVREQSLTYTSFQRPATLAENGYSTAFTYNAAGDRVKMHLTQGSTAVLTRYYIGGQYELDTQTNVERLYLGGDVYSAPAVYVKEAGNWNIYYICRDYLGSITHIANDNGSLKEEYSYDAWGRLRNPATQVAYTPGSEPVLFLGRGYTGHEHLPWFGLINMNARLYDAALGRFLSPDPYVQMPDFSQNFNRYSYCLNNPLIYIDPSGEWFVLDDLIAAVIGGAINLTVNLIQGNVTSFWHGAALFGNGFVGGVASLYVSPIAGAAMVSAGNSALSQGYTSGWSNIDWGQVGISGTLGAATSYLGGQLGSVLSKPISNLTSNIASPVLREAATQSATNAASGFTLNAALAWGNGASFEDGLKQGGQGALWGAGIGAMNGTVAGFKYAHDNKVNPWNGGDKLNSNNTSNHAQQRTVERNVSQNDINDAIKNPSKITDVKYDSQGRPSVKYIGNKVTVVVNPETGNIITIYPTSTQRINTILKTKK